MIRAVRNGCRLLMLARKLARHDALFVFDGLPATRPLLFAARPLVRRRPGRPGQRLAQALQDAGPSFIKFGQALASRSDLLGEEVAADLAELQDRLPPFPFDQVRATIEAEFGKPLEALFASFDPEPVAAASIAQVHFAIDSEGKEAAVKGAITSFLIEQGYIIAPVTLDNSDYMFAKVYANALAKSDSTLASRVRDTYLSYMESIYEFFETRSVEVTGHEIRHRRATSASA